MYNDAMYSLKTSRELLDPVRVFVSDKEYVKLYIKATIGDEYNVPTLKVLKSPEEVDTYDFPSVCCIKPTHSSGFVVFRSNDEPLDLNEIKRWFKLNYYDWQREVNYRYLKPKVIVEPLIFSTKNPADYKVYCNDGAPKAIAVIQDRHTDNKNQLLDTNWNALDYSIRYPRFQGEIEKPRNFEEMMEVATTLSKGFDGFIRVDLYSNGEEIKVGELTNISGGGESIFLPASSEKEFSRLLFG
ncbi:ATP-grasp fold amidoligase family protein [Flavimaribacter sediminis]